MMKSSKKTLSNFWKDPSINNGGSSNGSNSGGSSGNTTPTNISPSKLLAKEGQVFGVPLNDIFKRQSTVNNIPNVIYHISSNIRDSNMDVEGLFRIPGSNITLQLLKKQYNEGKITNKEDLNEKCDDIHTQASLLKLFIRELPDPLFTFSLYDSFIKSHATKDKKQIKLLLNQLPLANYSLLKYLAELLKDVATHSTTNRMTSTNLAIVFGPTVMRSEFESLDRMIEDARHINGIFLLIIDEYEYLFNNSEQPTFTSSPPSSTTNLLSNTAAVNGSPSRTNTPNKFIGIVNPNRKAAKFDFVMGDDNENYSNNNKISPLSPTNTPNKLTQHQLLQQLQMQQLLSISPNMSNQQNKFSILLPNNNNNNNNSNNNGKDSNGKDISPVMVGGVLSSGNLLAAPSSPTTFKNGSVSPLPPASPRSSLTLEINQNGEYIHSSSCNNNGGNNNGGNNELIRNLIKKTCSMLFDKEMPSILTDGFEITKDETFIPAFDNIHSSPTSSNDLSQISPRFIRTNDIMMTSSNSNSSTSSPQLRSLLKSHVNNNLSNLPNLLSNLQQQQQQSQQQPLPKVNFDENVPLATTTTTTNNNNNNNNQPPSPNIQSHNNNIIQQPTQNYENIIIANNALDIAMLHLDKVRKDMNRVSDINLMNIDELNEEKSAIKKELRDFDTSFKRQFGQLPRKNDKEIMRPLYIRYREVKSLIDLKSPTIQSSSNPNTLSLSSTPISLSSNSIKNNNQQTPPHIGSNSNNIVNTSSSSLVSNLSSSGQQQNDLQRVNSNSSISSSNYKNSSFSASPPNSNFVSPYISPSASFSSLPDISHHVVNNSNHNTADHNPTPMNIDNNSSNNTNNSKSNDFSKLSPNELKDKYLKIKGEKRLLQIELHKYQSEFTKKHGRKVQFVEDRVPVQAEYEKYKELKIEIGLIEKYLGINQQPQQQK